MLRHLRRIVVAFVGGVVVAVGVAMLVLPGPSILVIPAGLAILATEFQWARGLLHWARRTLGRGLGLFTRRPSSQGAGESESAPFNDRAPSRRRWEPRRRARL